MFPKNRNSSGGGILTAVDPLLDPVVTSSLTQDVEILTVQIEVGHNRIRLINGYAPQNDELAQKRLEFWTALDEEVVAAYREGCMILIQMDANAKVGTKVIPTDPNKEMDSNGHELMSLIDRHQLIMLNSDHRCKGVITRYRKTRNKVEQSILV